ncbi:MAG: hypothetical protein JSV80_06970 [Acidobacteriota bacterium]|nr:MAG: hypothetical protein JSV80_06970 [Acidobacteriota bacterium]
MRWCREAWLLSTLLLTSSGSPILGHGPVEPPPITVEGELVDLACYLAQGTRGEENAVCSSHHTSPNQPLALIADDGEIHVLYADHEGPYPYDRCRELAGRRARLTGVPAAGHGLCVLAVRKVTALDAAPEEPR